MATALDPRLLEAASPLATGLEEAQVGSLLRRLSVAERRIAELERQNAFLVGREERLKAIVGASTALVWCTAEPGYVVDPSLSWNTITGQTPEEYAGWGWLDAVHPEDRDGVRQRWLNALATSRAYESEYRLRRANGTYAHVLSRGVPIFGPEGRVVEWVGCFVDLSPLRLAERESAERFEQLKRAQEQLLAQERLAALGEVSAAVAHEIRNPLAAIFQALAVLRRRSEDPLIQVISEECERVNSIIGNLLDFARPFEASLAPESLASVAGEAARSVGLKFPDLNIVLDIDPAADSLCLDAQLVRQLFINLFENGAQAMGGRGRMTVRANPLRDCVRISVSDEGPGIPPELRDKIFAPFFTTRPAGTGLGLAVVRRIAESHGGRVTVDSSPSGGAVFRVELGRKKPTACQKA